MNVVTVEKQDWEPTSKNQRMEELPAETHVIHNPTKLVDNEGNAIAVITRTPEDQHAELTWMGRKILSDVDFTDIGSKTGGARMSGIKYPNRTFGTTAPSPMRRRLACCYAMMHASHPEITQSLYRLAITAWEILQEEAPEESRIASDPVYEGIHGDWLMAGTPWSSGIINHTAALSYHKDRGNIPNSWSAMYVTKRNVEGGYLHLPEYNLALACNDKDLIMFNGQQVWHGVTPVRKRTVGAEPYRFSIVYYAKSGCKICLSATEEIKRAQEAATVMDQERDTVLGPPRAEV